MADQSEQLARRIREELREFNDDNLPLQTLVGMLVDKARQARPEAAPVTLEELRCLAAGWVMEIEGEHQRDHDLFAAAKAYARTPGPEDDTPAADILRRCFGLPPIPSSTPQSQQSKA